MRPAHGWLTLGLLLPAMAAAQDPPTPETDRPEIRAVRASGPITLDGRLDEASWQRATPVSGMTQVDPDEGQPVSERTEARVVFDDDALYVGVRLHDRTTPSARLGRRDMPLSDSDWLGVVIDSYHDHRTGFSFDVNPAGVQRDALKSMGPGGREQDDLSWDPVWEARVSTDEGGWTAEYRIPFSQLRFGRSEQPVWGIQIERVIGRRREYAVFSFTPKKEQGGIPTYGHLVGLENPDPGQRLELLPYAVTRAEYVDPGANPFRDGSEHFGSGGVDLLYRVTSDFALNATFNPDFGQVEADPAEINLTVYETRFDEKRPFFIEGSEIFDFGRNTSGGQLFYSRRIGRRPQLGLPTPEGDLPDATTILGAGKLSGKTAGGWSLGFLESVTARE
ncbi:MAG: carbohydrate binding family 9 domain-containing protein, partial [Planctomycetota bacterium]